jgi:glycosyltransferase involved in cell wall biosynthesis
MTELRAALGSARGPPEGDPARRVLPPGLPSDRASQYNACVTPRVVLVSTYYHPVVGGCETHARQVGHYLHAHGFPVLVLTRRTPADAPARDEDRGVPVRRLRPAGPRHGLGKWLFLPALFVELVRLHRHYDIIFCVDLRGVALSALLVARLFRKRLVLQAETPGAFSAANWDVHFGWAGLGPGSRLVRALTWPLRRVHAMADAYTCIARQFMEEARAMGIPAERLYYVPHAVDEARFFPPASPEEVRAARARLGMPVDRPLVMYVGRLGVEKGILDLLEAWRQLAHPTAMLAVVGPDMTGHRLDAGPQARAFVREHGLEGSVRFLGPTTDPAPLLRAADIFVQPSHYEAFGISLIEAMATGLAIVASGVGGMADYLVHEENALVTGARAPERVAAALARLLASEQERRRFGVAARRTVEERFTEESLGRAYVALIRRLVQADRADAGGTSARLSA